MPIGHQCDLSVKEAGGTAQGFLQAVSGDILILGLFQTDVDPGPGALFGDFLECNFDSYARQVCNTLSPITLVQITDGHYQVQLQLATFGQPSSDTQTVWGWYIFSQSGHQMYHYKTFDSALTVSPTSGDLLIDVVLDFWDGGLVGVS